MWQQKCINPAEQDIENAYRWDNLIIKKGGIWQARAMHDSKASQHLQEDKAGIFTPRLKAPGPAGTKPTQKAYNQESDCKQGMGVTRRTLQVLQCKELLTFSMDKPKPSSMY